MGRRDSAAPSLPVALFEAGEPPGKRGAGFTADPSRQEVSNRCNWGKWIALPQASASA